MTIASLKAVVTHNLGLKSLVLLASFGLWYNIASEPELATIVSVPVDYKNFPKDLVISSNTVDYVAVEARGPANRLREMQETRVAAIVDFASVHAPGERTFTLTGSELRAPVGVTVVRTIPEQLRFHFERQITQKRGIDVKFSGTLPHGLATGDITITPQELEITGPESLVIAARRIQTDPYDLTRIVTDPEQELSTYVSEPELRFAGPPLVKVKIEVKRTR